MKALDRLVSRNQEDFFDPFGFSNNLPDLMKKLWEQPYEGKWNPRVDVIEKKKEIIIKADLPGIDEKDLSVELKDNILTLSGNRKEEKEVSEGEAYRFERISGSFVRNITLPNNLDDSKIDASYQKGVLNITIPKLAESTPKKITVKTR